jgi:hypothetical protein
MFFQSVGFTRPLLLSDRYKGLPEHFHPLLSQWHRKYTELKGEIDFGFIKQNINAWFLLAV